MCSGLYSFASVDGGLIFKWCTLQIEVTFVHLSSGCLMSHIVMAEVCRVNDKCFRMVDRDLEGVSYVR